MPALRQIAGRVLRGLARRGAVLVGAREAADLVRQVAAAVGDHKFIMYCFKSIFNIFAMHFTAFAGKAQIVGSRSFGIMTKRQSGCAVTKLTFRDGRGDLLEFPGMCADEVAECDLALSRMRTPAARRGMEAAFSAMPVQLSRAAVKVARKRR